MPRSSGEEIWVNAFTSASDRMTCTDFKHFLVNSSIWWCSALPLHCLCTHYFNFRRLRSFAIHVRKPIPSIMPWTALWSCHHSNSHKFHVPCDKLVYRAISCNNIVLSKLPPCFINLLGITFNVCRGPWLHGFSSPKICLCKTFLHHFFCTLPPRCTDPNSNAFRVSFSGADMAWRQSRNKAKWTEHVAFCSTNEMGEVQVQEACQKTSCAADNDSGIIVMMMIASASAVVWQIDFPCTLSFS